MNLSAVTTPQEQRAAWIEAVRWLAGRLEAALPVSSGPGGVPATPFDLYLTALWGKPAREALASWEAMLRAEDIPFTGQPGFIGDDASPHYWDLEWETFGTRFRVRFAIGAVAEKRVTGTRTVEDVEWVRIADAEPETGGAA